MELDCLDKVRYYILIGYSIEILSLYYSCAQLCYLHSHLGSSVQRNVAQNTQTISKIARPVGSGIPRPGGLGSRLPAPTAGRIPKLSTGSLPGSRASSLGPQRHPYSNEYC